MSVSGQDRKNIVLAAGTAVAYVSVNAAVANTWYQLISSTSSAIYITHVIDLGYLGRTLNVGTGAAASEVTAIVWYGKSEGSNSAVRVTALPIPVRVAAGTRVAARGDNTGEIGIMYVNESAVL